MSDDAQNQGTEDSERSRLLHRKRIVAHEVRSAAASRLRPEDVATSTLFGADESANKARAVDPRGITTPDRYSTVVDQPPPRPPGLGEFMLDPTTLGDRHRVRSHQRIYRLTLLSLYATWLGIAACLVLVRLDHVLRARAASVLTILIALAALRLARFNKLSRRLLGYAFAGAVVATITSALCLSSTFVKKVTGTPVRLPGPVVRQAPAQ